MEPTGHGKDARCSNHLDYRDPKHSPEFAIAWRIDFSLDSVLKECLYRGLGDGIRWGTGFYQI